MSIVCSPCVPTSTFSENCRRKPIGGFLPTLFYIPACEIASVERPYNKVTAITLTASSAGWRQVEAMKDSINFTDPFTANTRQVGHNLAFTIQNFAEADSDTDAMADAFEFANDLRDSKDPLVFVLQTRKGSRILVGNEDGLEADDDGNSSMGAAKADPNMTSFTFSQLIGEKPWVLDDSLVLPTA